MTEISGRRTIARLYGFSSDIGNSTEITSGCSRRSAYLRTAANSIRPERTGKNRSPPCVCCSRSNGARIPHRFFAERLLNSDVNRFPLSELAIFLKLHREPRDVDAVANGIAFVRGVRELQEVSNILQHAVA